MEDIKTKVDEELNKKDEIIGIHANAIVNKNIASPREVNKRMDALCMDKEIAKKIFGEDLYEQIKTKLQTTKDVLDIEDDKKIKLLPEFQTFLKKHMLTKSRKYVIDALYDKKATKENIKKIPLPENLQKENNELTTIEKAIRKTITESEEKNRGKLTSSYDIINNSKYLNEKEKEETKKLITNFMGGEYILGYVRDKINEKRKKLKEKITKYREKEANKINIYSNRKYTKETEEDIKTWEEEALELFRKNESEMENLKQKFYLPEENKSIHHIQEYFKKNMNETIASPDIEKIIIDNTIKGTTIKKKGDNIHVNANEYKKIKNRIAGFKNKFIKEENTNTRNPKEYLFDRLVEYIGKDILEHEIQQHKGKYNGLQFEEFEIYKTDTLDDTFGGADYIIIYTFKNERRPRIFPIDLFISDKELKENTNNNEIVEKGSLEEKLKKAKEPKIPYSTYIKLFKESDQDSFDMKTTTRYVEQQPIALTYSILQVVLEKNTNITELIKNFNIESPLYKNIKDPKDKEKIISYMNKNILKEIEKNAAQKVDI